MICICTACWHVEQWAVYGGWRGSLPVQRIQDLQTKQEGLNKNSFWWFNMVLCDRKGGPWVQWAAPWVNPPLLRFIDFMLEDWCRCRAETTALLRWCNILPRNKHQPGCQHKRRVLFKAASFKGEGLVLAGWWSTVMGEFKCSNYLKIKELI